MRLRAYLRSFFTRNYWQALGSLLTTLAFLPIQIHRDGWPQRDEEAEKSSRED